MLFAVRISVMPSEGCSACRLAQNPASPAAGVIITSVPAAIASWAAVTRVAAASGSARSPITASTPVAAGSSSNTSAAIRPNGCRVVAYSCQGSSSTGSTGNCGKRSSSAKQRTQ